MAMGEDLEKKRAREYAKVLEDLFLEEGWDVVLWDSSRITEGESSSVVLIVDPPGPLRKVAWATKGTRLHVKADPRGEEHDTLELFGPDRNRAAKVLDKRLGGASFSEKEEGYLIREGRR